MNGPVVVVGSGQAGLQVGLSLRDAGYRGPVTIVGDEPGLPYQRPPLSKAYLLGKVDEDGLLLRRRSVLSENRLDLVAPARVAEVRRQERSVRLADGRELPYAHLVLATGTRNRVLPVPGADLDGVVMLRSLADARALRARLPAARRAVVIGAGFIGLEFAAVASGLGLDAHVLEAADRVMARAVSPEMSAHFVRRHAERGVFTTLEAAVTEIVGEDGRATGVRTRDGTLVPADLVLVAIGVLPNDHIARDAGLETADGIVVDAHLLTSDPAISAIGDCAAHPNPFGRGLVRLESVQNAVDQARAVAARLAGAAQPYRAVPWFWSDQGPDKLQIAGLTAGADTRIVKGEAAAGRLMVICFRQDRLLGVETVNWAAEHMACRKILAAGVSVTPDQAATDGFTLRSVARSVGMAA